MVAGVRRTAKRRRGGRIKIDAMNTKRCFGTEEKTQGSPSDSVSDRDTDAATADSDENEVRRRNMRWNVRTQ